MRAIATVVLAWAFLYPWQALADPSADLVFCSRMPSKEERVSCYDAAARIAATKPRPPGPGKPARVQHVEQPVTPTVTPPVLANVVPGPFSGFYLGVGGGFGFAEPRSYFVGAPIFDSGLENALGWSGIAAAGYNVQAGNLVAGFEVRGRFGSESDSSFNTFQQNTTGNTATFTSLHKFQTDAGVHLFGRAGLALGDTMIFGYGGVGGAHTVETVRFTSVGTICTQTVFQGGQATCVANAPAPTFAATQMGQWMPSFAFGAGIEHNIGSWFGRISAEREGIADGGELFWTARAYGLIGYRF